MTNLLLRAFGLAVVFGFACASVFDICFQAKAFTEIQSIINYGLNYRADRVARGWEPYRHADAQHDIWGGHGLETFGEDFEIVRRQDPAFVWTVVDGDSGVDQWITAGVHYVNRVCYLVTEIPHDSIPVEFRVRRGPHSLTPLGLKRQLLRLDRLVKASELKA